MELLDCTWWAEWSPVVITFPSLLLSAVLSDRLAIINWPSSPSLVKNIQVVDFTPQLSRRSWFRVRLKDCVGTDDRREPTTFATAFLIFGKDRRQLEVSEQCYMHVFVLHEWSCVWHEQHKVAFQYSGLLLYLFLLLLLQMVNHISEPLFRIIY